jgi:hypothetical protein
MPELVNSGHFQYIFIIITIIPSLRQKIANQPKNEKMCFAKILLILLLWWDPTHRI